MALFRSERGIGRGEVAESRLEAPLFAGFMLVCGMILAAQHFYLGNQSITFALAVSLLVFGATVVRVEYGLYVLIIAMLLSPEIDAGTAISGERNLNIRYDDVLIIVIFLGVMVKLSFEGRLSLWQPSPINAGIATYYALCVLSTLLACQRGLGAWDGRSACFIMLKMLEFYLLFFLVGHATRDLRDVKKILVLLFGVALVVSLYGIYSIGATPRVSAPFEKGGTEPNTLGGYLVIIICLCVALWTQAPRLWRKLLLLAIGGITFVPFLYTLSRASYLALAVGIATIAVISRNLIIAAVMVLVLAFSPILMPKEVKERVAYTIQHQSGYEVANTGISVDKSTAERFQVWRKVKYILGRGPVLAALGGGVSWESVLDSQYARVILETGLLGLAAFLFLQFTVLRTTRNAYRWTEDWLSRGIAMGTFAATLALMVHSVGTISFLIVRIMEPYWLLVALCVNIRNMALAHHWARARAENARGESETPAPRPPFPQTDVSI